MRSVEVIPPLDVVYLRQLFMYVAFLCFHLQTCDDVDECEIDNGGCDPTAECVNTPGSYSCGFCPPGYIGNGFVGCSPGDYCAMGLSNCHLNATCVSTGAGTFVCEVCMMVCTYVYSQCDSCYYRNRH